MHPSDEFSIRSSHRRLIILQEFKSFPKVTSEFIDHGISSKVFHSMRELQAELTKRMTSSKVAAGTAKF